MPCPQPQLHFSDRAGNKGVYLGPWTAYFWQAFGLVPFSFKSLQKVTSGPNGNYTLQRAFSWWLSSAALLSGWTTWMLWGGNVHSVRPLRGSVHSRRPASRLNREVHSRFRRPLLHMWLLRLLPQCLALRCWQQLGLKSLERHATSPPITEELFPSVRCIVLLFSLTLWVTGTRWTDLGGVTPTFPNFSPLGSFLDSAMNLYNKPFCISG